MLTHLKGEDGRDVYVSRALIDTEGRIHDLKPDETGPRCCLALGQGIAYFIRGTASETHAAIYGTAPAPNGDDFYLSGKAVVAALTHKYRMTLDEPEPESPGHRIRVAIRSAAEEIGVTLDEALLNTPLPDATSPGDGG